MQHIDIIHTERGGIGARSRRNGRVDRGWTINEVAGGELGLVPPPRYPGRPRGSSYYRNACSDHHSKLIGNPQRDPSRGSTKEGFGAPQGTKNRRPFEQQVQTSRPNSHVPVSSVKSMICPCICSHHTSLPHHHHRHNIFCMFRRTCGMVMGALEAPHNCKNRKSGVCPAMGQGLGGTSILDPPTVDST